MYRQAGPCIVFSFSLLVIFECFYSIKWSGGTVSFSKKLSCIATCEERRVGDTIMWMMAGPTVYVSGDQGSEVSGYVCFNYYAKRSSSESRWDHPMCFHISMNFFVNKFMHMYIQCMVIVK